LQITKKLYGNLHSENADKYRNCLAKGTPVATAVASLHQLHAWLRTRLNNAFPNIVTHWNAFLEAAFAAANLMVDAIFKNAMVY
jgi:hypothetical protein